jgi:hypothetical protein
MKSRQTGRASLLLPLVAAVIATSCEPPDRPRTETGTSPGAGSDPATLLSSDPVDQINRILSEAVYRVPGEPFETRYQVRVVAGDTLAVDYEQREAGGDWYAGATGFASLRDVTAELSMRRRIRFRCAAGFTCFKYRAPMDELALGRLPAGEGRERFLEVLARYSTGGASGGPEPDEAEINRGLRESAISFSETVSSWYQVSFQGNWMEVVTWQFTEGFTEHTTPGVLLVHLPGLGTDDEEGAIACREPGCVLYADDTPIRMVPPTPEMAEQVVALLNRLKPTEADPASP